MLDPVEIPGLAAVGDQDPGDDREQVEVDQAEGEEPHADRRVGIGDQRRGPRAWPPPDRRQ
jgi:hypothetical protein